MTFRKPFNFETGTSHFGQSSRRGMRHVRATPQHPNVNNSSGVVTLDSSGNLSGSFDSNGPSGPNAGGITDTLTVDATTGRATTTGGSILYIISPSKAVLMESGADSSVQIVEK